MENVQLWKLVLDGLLVLSLLYFCLRFARDSGSRLDTRALGLETSLRALIRDAEQAGKALNSELVKRQSDLEKLLFDIKSAESRLDSAIRNAETVKNSFGPELSQAEHVMQQIQQVTASAGQYVPRQAPVERREVMESRSQLDKEVTVEAVTLREEVPATPRAEKPQPQLQQRQPQPQVRQEARPQAVNIYGEPIGEAEPAPRVEERPAQSLNRQVETYATQQSAPAAPQQTQPAEPVASASDHNVIQEVYDKAEKLLMAGSDLRSVASQTSLSVEEVRMLAQMMESDAREQAEAETISRTDERLGVLGSMKRTVQQV